MNERGVIIYKTVAGNWNFKIDTEFQSEFLGWSVIVIGFYHDVSSVVHIGLHQMYVDPGSRQGISKWTIYPNYRGRSTAYV